MSLITDIRAVSENAIEQIAARFSDLPRPLLAAIGAGDMAIERLADLRESLMDSIGERATANPLDVGDVRSAVSDLPAKAQKVAAEVAGSIEQFASDAPARAQEMIAQFPERLAEFQTVAQSLSPDAFRETLEAYTQLVGMIYGSLATRGDKTWSKVMAIGIRPGTIVDADPVTPWPPKAAAADPAPKAAGPVTPLIASENRPTGAAPRRTPTAATVTTTRLSSRTAARQPSPVRTGAPVAPSGRKPRTAASGPAATSGTLPKSAAKPATPTSAAKPTTPKSAAKPATPKSAAKPATPKSAAKPATPKSAAKPEPIAITGVPEG